MPVRPPHAASPRRRRPDGPTENDKILVVERSGEGLVMILELVNRSVLGIEERAVRRSFARRFTHQAPTRERRVNCIREG